MADARRTRFLGKGGRLTLAGFAVAGVMALSPPGALAHHHHPAKLTISNASVREPNGSATAKARFTVKISHAKRRVVKASYRTVDGSAGPSDFRARQGVVRIKPGHRHAHIAVVVLGDGQHEANETFRVKLSHVKRAHAKRATGVGTILDNDAGGGGNGGGGNGGGGGGGSTDTDGDGIPDGLDACPKDYDPDGYCPVSVYDVNDGTIGPGSRVRIKNLMVTAIDRPSKLIWAQSQPGDDGDQGVKDSAVELVEPTAVPGSLAIGDRVNVTGRTATGEFDLASLNDTSSGGAPAAASLPLSSIGNPRYADVLGSVSGETLTTTAASRWTMFDGLSVPDQIIGTLPTRSAGAYFATVTGIVSGTDVTPTLMPRKNADIVDGTAPARTVASIHITDDCVNVGETHQAVATLKLSGPASDPETVAMSASSPAALDFDNVIVAPGTDSAMVRVSGEAVASAVTLTGALNGPGVDSDGTLDVRDPQSDDHCTIDTN